MLTIIFLTNSSDPLFLKSLKSASFANKILIFDYQSANDWKKLKKIYPQITLLKKCGKIEDFAKVRNEAIKMVDTDWLFFLDSDEILEKGSQKKLEKLIKSNFNGFSVKREDYFHGKKLRWGEVHNNYLLRIAKKEKIKFERKVHEKAIVEGRIKKSNININHHAHQNIEEFFATISNYSELEAKYRKESTWTYSKIKLLTEMIIFPPLKFSYNYFLKLGFLDGFAGLVYALLMSFHSLLVRIYLYENYFL